MLNKQVDKYQLSISFKPITKINKLKNNLLSWLIHKCMYFKSIFLSQFLDKAIIQLSTFLYKNQQQKTLYYSKKN